jgi:hypothetical protein
MLSTDIILIKSSNLFVSIEEYIFQIKVLRFSGFKSLAHCVSHISKTVTKYKVSEVSTHGFVVSGFVVSQSIIARREGGKEREREKQRSKEG